MAYFLRFTTDPLGDIERGTSYHLSDLKQGDIYDDCGELLEGDDEIEKVALLFGCDASEIEVFKNGAFVQSLGGLCCFELEGNTIDDAIESAKNISSGSYSFNTHCDMAYIFEGDYYDSCPEGAIMSNPKLICKI